VLEFVSNPNVMVVMSVMEQGYVFVWRPSVSNDICHCPGICFHPAAVGGRVF